MGIIYSPNYSYDTGFCFTNQLLGLLNNTRNKIILTRYIEAGMNFINKTGSSRCSIWFYYGEMLITKYTFMYEFWLIDSVFHD